MSTEAIQKLQTANISSKDAESHKELSPLEKTAELVRRSATIFATGIWWVTRVCNYDMMNSQGYSPRLLNFTLGAICGNAVDSFNEKLPFHKRLTVNYMVLGGTVNILDTFGKCFLPYSPRPHHYLDLATIVDLIATGSVLTAGVFANVFSNRM